MQYFVRNHGEHVEAHGGLGYHTLSYISQEGCIDCYPRAIHEEIAGEPCYALSRLVMFLYSSPYG